MFKMAFKEHIKNQKVSDLHISEDSITCSPTDTILSVVELLAEKKIGSVIILDQETTGRRPVGIFTERDLVRCSADSSFDISKELISNHMTPNPRTVRLNTTLMNVMAAMRMGKFRHLVITDDAGDLTGVISIRDVMVHLLDELNDVS